MVVSPQRRGLAVRDRSASAPSRSAAHHSDFRSNTSTPGTAKNSVVLTLSVADGLEQRLGIARGRQFQWSDVLEVRNEARRNRAGPRSKFKNRVFDRSLGSGPVLTGDGTRGMGCFVSTVVGVIA